MYTQKQKSIIKVKRKDKTTREAKRTIKAGKKDTKVVLENVSLQIKIKRKAKGLEKELRQETKIDRY